MGVDDFHDDFPRRVASRLLIVVVGNQPVGMLKVAYFSGSSIPISAISSCISSQVGRLAVGFRSR